jgi:hypothetical protein
MQHTVREHRRKVVIRAKMRAGGPQVDVCVRDISSMGLMLQTNEPPPRGTYVEVVGAGQTIIGRVIWAKDRRFGVRTNDPINVSAAILGIQSPPIQSPPLHRSRAPGARSQCSTIARTYDESNRMLAKVMEFAVVGAFIAILVIMMASTVYETLHRPVEHIELHLGRGD